MRIDQHRQLGFVQIAFLGWTQALVWSYQPERVRERPA